MLCEWNDLPKTMQNEEVKPYYLILQDKKTSLYLKRFLDILLSLVLLILLLPIFLLLSILIKLDSEGPVFYKQTRITQYGKHFQIFKFRSMTVNADKQGALITSKNDVRVTRVGKYIRKFRLDEISQLINVLLGDMTFVGTRPEVPKYVAKYSKEMWATLLLPAGITSLASIHFADESSLLENSRNIDQDYCKKILPIKMKYNLSELQNFSVISELKILALTALVALGIEVKPNNI